MKRDRSAVVSTVFYVLCTVGMLLAVSLGIGAAVQGSAIQLGEEQEERVGAESIVRVGVRNVSDSVQCPVVRIAARDIEELDLANVVARPVEGEGVLSPGQRVLYEGVIDELSEQERREELREFRAYVAELPGECS